jgi:hypothetical protein
MIDDGQARLSLISSDKNRSSEKDPARQICRGLGVLSLSRRDSPSSIIHRAAPTCRAVRVRQTRIVGFHPSGDRTFKRSDPSVILHLCWQDYTAGLEVSNEHPHP